MPSYAQYYNSGGFGGGLSASQGMLAPGTPAGAPEFPQGGLPGGQRPRNRQRLRPGIRGQRGRFNLEGRLPNLPEMGPGPPRRFKQGVTGDDLARGNEGHVPPILYHGSQPIGINPPPGSPGTLPAPPPQYQRFGAVPPQGQSNLRQLLALAKQQKLLQQMGAGHLTSQLQPSVLGMQNYGLLF